MVHVRSKVLFCPSFSDCLWFNLRPYRHLMLKVSTLVLCSLRLIIKPVWSFSHRPSLSTDCFMGFTARQLKPLYPSVLSSKPHQDIFRRTDQWQHPLTCLQLIRPPLPWGRTLYWWCVLLLSFWKKASLTQFLQFCKTLNYSFKEIIFPLTVYTNLTDQNALFQIHLNIFIVLKK